MPQRSDSYEDGRLHYHGLAMIVCATWNARSIARKRLELIDFLKKENITLIALSETHLNPSLSFHLPEHLIVRVDREDSKGGVAIAVHRSLKYRILPLPATRLIEVVGVEVTTSHGSFRFYSVYCPRQARDSDGTVRLFKNDLQILTRTPGRFIVAGDLNARHRHWGNAIANKNGTILWGDMQAGYYKIAYPPHPTYQSNGSYSTLDLFLTNMEVDDPVTVTALSSDHLPVLMSVDGSGTQPKRQRLNYRAANWLAFKRIMERSVNIDAPLRTISDIDIALTELENNINDAVNTCVPRVEVKTRLEELDLVTKSLIQQKNSLRRHFQRTGNKSFYSAFRLMCKMIQDRLSELHNMRFAEDVKNIKKNARPLWRVIKVLKSRPKPIPPLKENSIICFTPEEKVKILAETFEKAHKISDNIISPYEEIVQNSVHRITNAPFELPDVARVSCDEVQRLIKYSVAFKAPGADNMFNITLKHLGVGALSFIANIFNRCFELGYFPKCWRFAKVIPIRKPGKDPCLASSYRPISLLSVLSKIFERILHARMEDHCDVNNIITEIQFGFRKGHSTAHQIQRMLNIINNGKSFGKSTAITLLDVEKAFDNVWHQGLLYKLEQQRFPLYIIRMIQSYLSRRTSSVYLGGISSEPYDNKAGVPQGSVLGPLLYNCYTSDVPSLGNNTELSLYADDTAILHQQKYLACLHGGLQRALGKYVSYLNDWKIVVNCAKTQAIVLPYKKNMWLSTIRRRVKSIKLQGHAITWDQHVRYLGVVIDRKLSFKHHIDYLKTKVLGTLMCLYPLIKRNGGLTSENKLILYKQVILPALLYGSNAWGTCSSANMLVVQRVQNKFLKMILNLPVRYGTNDLHKLAQIPMISDRISTNLDRLINSSMQSSSTLIRDLFL